MEQKSALLEQDADLASVHTVLLRAPDQLPLHFDRIVAQADELFRALPPDSLLRETDPLVTSFLREHR